MSDDQEKTEDPTPKKLEDARNKGDVPTSKEFATFIVFLGLALSFYFSAEHILEKLTFIFQSSFAVDQIHPSTSREVIEFSKAIAGNVASILAPIFMAVFIFGAFSYMGQFGILFTAKKLIPDFNKINPMSGFKRIFSRDTFVELIKSILKLVVLGMILYVLFKGEVEAMMTIGMSSVADIFLYMMKLAALLFITILCFTAVLGAIDFSYQRWSFNEKQKMSQKEVKDEMKQREGDPHVKARIRQIQREAARARMMEAVPHADVVVANPTHVAVAIRYERGASPAPKIVAKGAGHIAVKIKELAIQSGVPVLEKKSLARYLYRNVEIGQFVPESLFSAVAEVLAYVYKIKRKYRAFTASKASAQTLQL